MKKTIMLMALFLTGCVSSKRPQEVEIQYPVQTGTSESDGYTFETWVEEDGSVFFVRKDKRMDYHKKGNKL